MENLGRACCVIAGITCFLTACSFPLLASYLDVAGPQWLVDDAAKSHANGHGSGLDLTLIFTGMAISILGFALIMRAAVSNSHK